MAFTKEHLQNAKMFKFLDDKTVLSELKAKVHAEAFSLYYLYGNFGNIMNTALDELSQKNNIVIQDIFINIASFRDLCSTCSNITTTPFFQTILTRFKEKFIEKKIKIRDHLSIIILASGISEYDDGTYKTRSHAIETNLTPINIPLSTNSKLYFSRSPYYVEKTQQETLLRNNIGPEKW